MWPQVGPGNFPPSLLFGVNMPTGKPPRLSKQLAIACVSGHGRASCALKVVRPHAAAAQRAP
jgi:hypothetical protein